MSSHSSRLSPVARARNGAALVATLALLALLTGIVVAFVLSVSSDRQSSQRYARVLQADEIGRGGLASVVSLLREEIADPARSTNFFSVSGGASNLVYRPVQASYAAPERMAVPALASNPGLASVVKVSLPGVPFYGTASGAGTASPASAVSTSQTSLNGRSVGLSRWSRSWL
ncbi:MAG TPA: hypothetical protein VIM58_10190, partial [Candidatus Methylacidiphilales bacterium]